MSNQTEILQAPAVPLLKTYVRKRLLKHLPDWYQSVTQEATQKWQWVGR